MTAEAEVDVTWGREQELRQLLETGNIYIRSCVYICICIHTSILYTYVCMCIRVGASVKVHLSSLERHSLADLGEFSMS